MIDGVHSQVVINKMISHLTIFSWTALLICSMYYAYNIPEISILKKTQMDSMVDMNRIIGGSKVRIEDYPHQGSMVMNNSFFCGCFVMSENWIGTAAHCVEGFEPKDLAVRIGSKWRYNGTLVPIEYYVMHSGYDNPPFDKDIAVMKTVEPINFTDTIQPVSLPYRGQILETSSMVNVSGWGRTWEGSSLPDELMAVEIQVYSDMQCLMSYFTYYTENMFCGGNYWFINDGSCQGDSGGAVIQNDVIVGIVSYGRVCGDPLSPPVFAKVAMPAIRDFISNTTGL